MYPRRSVRIIYINRRAEIVSSESHPPFITLTLSCHEFAVSITNMDASRIGRRIFTAPTFPWIHCLEIEWDRFEEIQGIKREGSCYY